MALVVSGLLNKQVGASRQHDAEDESALFRRTCKNRCEPQARKRLENLTLRPTKANAVKFEI
jgi:DNA-binding TFAR19-related protein (PDSD5 family)